MMKRKKHTLWLELGGAVLWCLVTLFTDKLFFWYDWHSWRFFAYKALFILAAFGVIHGVVTLVQKVREKDSFTLRWLRWTLPYLAVTLLLLLVLSLLDVGGRSISRIIFAVWSACYGLIF